MSWNDNEKLSTLRYVVHIADAPPHGRRFGYKFDEFPDGCPDGIKVEDVAKLFYYNNIRYRLYKVGPHLVQMEKIFQEYFPNIKTVDINSADQMRLEVSRTIMQEVQQEPEE